MVLGIAMRMEVDFHRSRKDCDELELDPKSHNFYGSLRRDGRGGGGDVLILCLSES